MALTLLGLDTTGEEIVVGLLTEQGMVMKKAPGRPHSHALLPLIAKVLGRRRPTAIVVSVGPGSYTGTRVGVTTANSLAWTWQVPVFGIAKDRASTMKGLLSIGREKFERKAQSRLARPQYVSMRQKRHVIIKKK